MEAGYFFSPVEKSVDLGNGNTVVIRALSYGERQSLQSQCMRTSASRKVGGRKGKREEEEAEGEVTIDAPLLSRLTWHKAIVSWDGPGFGSQPVSPDNIDKLPTWILDRLTEELNDLDQGEDVKNG